MYMLKFKMHKHTNVFSMIPRLSQPLPLFDQTQASNILNKKISTICLFYKTQSNRMPTICVGGVRGTRVEYVS